MKFYFSGWRSGLAQMNSGVPRKDWYIPRVNGLFPSFYEVDGCPSGKDLITWNLSPQLYGSAPVILDSGAHAVMNQSGSGAGAHRTVGRDSTAINMEDYAAMLMTFVRDNPLVSRFIELDLAATHGMDSVNRWRAMFVAAGLADRMIPAWHPENGWDDWLKMLDMPGRYIALEGPRKNRPPLPYLEMIGMAYNRGIKVHVFAVASLKQHLAIPMASTDCTTWLAAAKYGLTPRFDKHAMRTHFQEVGGKSRKQGQRPEVTKEHHMSLRGKLDQAIGTMLTIEQQVTSYWKVKGVDWDKQTGGQG